MINRYLAICYTALSAILFYLSYPNIIFSLGCSPLAWIALVPFFLSLEGQKLTDRIKIGALFGFLSFFLTINWLLPINFLGYFVLTMTLAIAPIFFAILFSCPFKNHLVRLIYVPGLWVSTELLRSILMGGFSWTLGHTQTFYPAAIQLSDITGSYGISFILVLFNFCLFGILKDYEARYWNCAIAITAVFVLLGYGCYRLEKKVKNPTQPEFWEIAMMQPNISPNEKWDNTLIDQVIDKHIRLTRFSLKDNSPDIVIWPETSIPDDFIRDPHMRDKISKIATEIKTHFLLGAALIENNQDYNSAVLLNGRGAVLDIYRKKYLVPFTEYLPFKHIFSFLRDVFNFNIFDFYPGNRLGVFTVHKILDGDNYRERKFGVTLCSEGSYPHLFRQLAAAKVGFIVIMLNDGWFHSKSALIMHTQHEIMRAAENHVPIVRAANSGWSCSIDEYGRIKGNPRNNMKLMKPGYYLTHVFPYHTTTIYNKYGDIFSFACILFVIMNLIRWFILFRQGYRGFFQNR